jgi:hypothetical protein
LLFSEFGSVESIIVLEGRVFFGFGLVGSVGWGEFVFPDSGEGAVVPPKGDLLMQSPVISFF